MFHSIMPRYPEQFCHRALQKHMRGSLWRPPRGPSVLTSVAAAPLMLATTCQPATTWHSILCNSREIGIITPRESHTLPPLFTSAFLNFFALKFRPLSTGFFCLSFKLRQYLSVFQSWLESTGNLLVAE